MSTEERISAIAFGAAKVLEKDAFNIKGVLKAVPKSIGKFYTKPVGELFRAVKGTEVARDYGKVIERDSKAIRKALAKTVGVYGGTAGAIGGSAYWLYNRDKKINPYL